MRADALGREHPPCDGATRIDGEMVSWYGRRAIAGLRYLAGQRRQLA